MQHQVPAEIASFGQNVPSLAPAQAEVFAARRQIALFGVPAALPAPPQGVAFALTSPFLVPIPGLASVATAAASSAVAESAASTLLSVAAAVGAAFAVVAAAGVVVGAGVAVVFVVGVAVGAVGAVGGVEVVFVVFVVGVTVVEVAFVAAAADYSCNSGCCYSGNSTDWSHQLGDTGSPDCSNWHIRDWVPDLGNCCRRFGCRNRWSKSHSECSQIVVVETETVSFVVDWVAVAVAQIGYSSAAAGIERYSLVAHCSSWNSSGSGC